jgi:hypothetical protein
VTVSFSDSMNLINHQIKWCSKGMRLLTKWPFRDGTEIEFSFDHQGERHCCVGIVVGCYPLRRPLGCFETILFFLDAPCAKLVKAACECQLAREHHFGQTQFTTHNQAVDGVSHDGAKKSVRAGSSVMRAGGAKTNGA